MPQVRTAALGIWIGAGSRYEEDRQAGISHFLEHMFFKGTDTRSALDIAQAADAVGAQLNAFTDREATVLYAKALARHLPHVCDLTADMLLHSALDPEALERERQVILEEIKMYEDSPDELVQDLFAQTIWNGHPLGRPVIGSVETVQQLRREDFLGYQERRYRPNNVIVAVAGDVVHSAMVQLVADTLGGWQGTAAPLVLEPPQARPDITLRAKETEQVHLTLGMRGLPQAHDARHAMAILDNILGGGMSSRLFQEIREKRGLVYTITSYHAAYREGGLFVIYGAMSPSAAPQVTGLILKEIEKIKDGVSAAELQRAKESYKGAIMLSLVHRQPDVPAGPLANLLRPTDLAGRVPLPHRRRHCGPGGGDGAGSARAGANGDGGDRPLPRRRPPGRRPAGGVPRGGCRHRLTP